MNNREKTGCTLNGYGSASGDQTAGDTPHLRPWLVSCPRCIFLPNLWLVVAGAFMMRDKRETEGKTGQRAKE